MTTAAVDDVADDSTPDTDAGLVADGDTDAATAQQSGGSRWSTRTVFLGLPVLALILALAAGFLRWQDASVRGAEQAALDSVTAARDSTIALLSYQPGTADKDLVTARDRLTGAFRNDYTKLTDEVVIPGAKQKQISAAATVPAAASVWASENRAVALVFVDQTVIVGDGAPTGSASSVRVTLDKVDGRWLISGFEPI